MNFKEKSNKCLTKMQTCQKNATQTYKTCQKIICSSDTQNTQQKTTAVIKAAKNAFYTNCTTMFITVTLCLIWWKCDGMSEMSDDR